MSGRKRRVAYTYDPDIGNFTYGPGHPMKPYRVRMTHHLIVGYGLHKHMEVFRPVLVDGREMTRFHTDDYVNFLRCISPDNMTDHIRALQRYAIGDDCPVFDGLFEWCQMFTSASIGGAARLNSGEADVAVNWAGGFHHAKKSEASGFCYVNDIVLAILELLKVHRRVLYIDIDIHHGDGVEEAFYTTDRVMCVSFHKFGSFFPGTGHWRDIGYGAGKGTSINFPLRDGLDDASFWSIFVPIISKVMERYQPEAVVMMCGADSLAGDRLGCFNLSIEGHSDAVKFVKSFGLPTLVLGGGGYTLRNVARAWTKETAVMLDVPVSDELPYCESFEYYGPTYRLSLTPSNMENKNTAKYLDHVRSKLLETLSELEAVPGVPIETGASELRTPKPFVVGPATAPDDEEVTEARYEQERVVHAAEFYDDHTDHDHRDAAASGGGASSSSYSSSSSSAAAAAASARMDDDE